MARLAAGRHKETDRKIEGWREKQKLEQRANRDSCTYVNFDAAAAGPTALLE